MAWQIPSYFLVAISEIFAVITGLEYAFMNAPPSMKSIVVSIFYSTKAVGSALNLTLIPVNVDPKTVMDVHIIGYCHIRHRKHFLYILSK